MRLDYEIDDEDAGQKKSRHASLTIVTKFAIVPTDSLAKVRIAVTAGTGNEQFTRVVGYHKTGQTYHAAQEQTSLLKGPWKGDHCGANHSLPNGKDNDE